MKENRCRLKLRFPLSEDKGMNDRERHMRRYGKSVEGSLGELRYRLAGVDFHIRSEETAEFLSALTLILQENKGR